MADVAMFRRRQQPTPHQFTWTPRIERARGLIVDQGAPDWVVARVDELTAALRSAEADSARLASALAGLDVDGATAELKDALRRQQQTPSPDHEALVASRRERYETIHAVVNRRDAIRTTIDRVVADVELLAARSVELSLRAGAWELDELVGRLRTDLTALDQARAEVRDL